MRVVLDTSVVVSSLLGGSLHVILDQWKAGRFTLVVSEAIMWEYLDVIHRPKFKLTAQEIASTTERLLEAAEFVSPAETLDVITADPSDNKFLEAAVEGHAVYVVSGDSHLLELKSFRGIAIISARDLIARLK